MGVYQPLRGNAENKLFYKIDRLIGGINTEFSDDTSPDNEFREIINFDMDTRGSLHKRLGFGKLDALSQLFNLFSELPTIKSITPEDPNPHLLNDNLVYAKLLQNDNKVFRNLSAFSGEKAYRDYQKLYGAQGNTFKLLLITTSLLNKTSTAWLYEVKLPVLLTDNQGEYLDDETIELTETKTDLAVIFTWNKNLFNIETIDFFNKIYFTSNNKGLVVFDRSTDTFAYYGFNSTTPLFDNSAYKPSAMEIRKVGFNMLGDDPLYWLNTQGLTTESIQGIYITSSNSKPCINLPFGSSFFINILHTGVIDSFALELKEGENELTFTATDQNSQEDGLAIFKIELQSIPTQEVEIKVEKVGANIEPYYDYYSVGPEDLELKEVEALNIGDYGICEMYNRAVYYKGDTIWFSEINNFDYVPNYNYVSLPIEPTDEITKVVFFRNVHIVFTKQRIYKMIGQFGTTDFQVMPVNMSIGCHAPNTVAPVENELFFASPRGLYALRSSEFRDGIENLKELDTKVKSLTSDLSLYVKELTDPAIRYNGISEQAYGLRYKEKYMLFFNTSYEAGELTAPQQNDVLVYKYELKAFTSIKFAIKPTFMFFVDGAMEAFATIQEKEEFTERETLLEYDFETGTSNDILDLSGNELHGELHSGYLQPGYGVLLDDGVSYLKLATVSDTVNLTNGFEIEMDIEPEKIDQNSFIFDFGQANETAGGVPYSFNVETEKSNGYKLVLQCLATPNAVTGKYSISYTAVLFRDNTSINDTQTGTFKLTTPTETLINTTSFTFAFVGSSLETIVKTGTFNVTHEVDKTYSKSWTLQLNSKYPTHESGYDKEPNTTDDRTINASWGSYFGIRLQSRTVVYDWGSRVYVRPAFAVGTYGYIDIGKREMRIWINGTKVTTQIPAAEKLSDGTKYFWGDEKYVDVPYLGAKTIKIDAQYNIRATIGGVYRENLDIPDYNFTLPTITHYDITTWHDFMVNKAQTITLNTLLIPSKQEIYAKIGENGSIIFGVKSEYGSAYILSGENKITTELLKLKFTVVREINKFVAKVYKNGNEIASGDIPLLYINNANRNSALIGKYNSSGYEFVGMIYYFSWKLANETYVAKYDFKKGRGTTVPDTSSAGRSATLEGSVSWLVENGLFLNGLNSYVEIPELSHEILWSNGFTIEFEARIEDVTKVAKVLDLAIGYNTGASNNKKSSINIGLPGLDRLDFMSSSIELKSMKLSTGTPIGATARHLWQMSVTDNGKNYVMTIKKDNVTVVTDNFSYGGITNVTRKSNFIGRSNAETESYLKAMLYNLKIDIHASANPVPVFVGAIYEYDTTYDDFGRAMEVVFETKGINMHYPLHIKKLKNIFIKGLGGFAFQEFLCFVRSDGHLVNHPYLYSVYVDPNTQEIVYEYEENHELEFNEKLSLLGSLRLDHTSLGEHIYETRKLVIPAKGKNFSVRFEGQSSDSLSIESLGFTVKLGKVKER